MAVSKDQPMRPAEVALLEAAEALADPASYSKSGEIIETDNAADYPLLSLTVHGKSVQDGTPTPDNPVPVQVVGAYQMLKPPYAVRLPYTHRGVTYTDAGNGGVHVSGTATEGDSFVSLMQYNSANNNLTVGDTYTINTVSNDVKARVYSATGGTTTAQHVTYTVLNESWQMLLVVPNNVTVDETIYPSISAGTEPKPYTPYGCIGLQIGETVTPIDLQGHELADRDALTIDRNGNAVINGETVLPSIVMPTPIDGGTVRIVANVTPEIDVSYVAQGMRGGILVMNNYADDLAALDVRITAMENELDSYSGN